MMAAKIRIPFISRFLRRDAFAEQASRPEHQHQHEHAERDHILPLVSKTACPDVFEQPEDYPAHQRATDVADAAQHRGRERLDTWDEPDVEPCIETQAVHQSGDTREDAADDEGRRDDPVDVHTHEAGSLGVLRDGPDAFPDPRSMYQ